MRVPLLFALALSGISCGGVGGTPTVEERLAEMKASGAISPWTTAEHEDARELTFKMRQAGLIKKFQQGSGEAWVEPALWFRMTYEEKKGITVAIAIVDGPPYGPVFRVRDNYDGRTLAVWKREGGFEIP